jgi:hypothetical protein
MHGRTARASIDECNGHDAFIEHPTGVPGVRAFSSLWAIAGGAGQGCVRVRVAPGGIPSGRNDNVASSDGPASHTARPPGGGML